MFLHLSCGDGGEGQRRARVCARGARSAGRRRLARARAHLQVDVRAQVEDLGQVRVLLDQAPLPRAVLLHALTERVLLLVRPLRRGGRVGASGGRNAKRGASSAGWGAQIRGVPPRVSRTRGTVARAHLGLGGTHRSRRILRTIGSTCRVARPGVARASMAPASTSSGATRRRVVGYPGKSLSRQTSHRDDTHTKKMHVPRKIGAESNDDQPPVTAKNRAVRAGRGQPAWDGPTARRRRHTERRVRARTHARAFDPARAPRVASARSPRVRLCRARPSPPWVPRR